MAFNQTQKILSSSPIAEMNFGNSIDIDGEYLVIGVPNEDIGANTNAGAVYIYYRDANAVWYLNQRIQAPTPAINAYFGYAVSIYRKYIVVGSYGNNSSRGRVDMFTTDGSAWSNTDNITITGAAANDEFGKSVDIHGYYVIAGAPGENGNTGSAYITKFNTNGIFDTEVELPTTLVTIDDDFGVSVAIYNNFAVVGASGDNNNSGTVYAYIYDDENADWDLLQSIGSSNREENSYFGCSVSMFEDIFVVGARNETSDSGDAYVGAVYIYKKFNNIWSEIGKLGPSVETNGNQNNNFGFSVDIKNNYLSVGAPGARNDRGFVDIFDKTQGWKHLIKLVASDGATNYSFGRSVAVAGYFSAIGSPLFDSSVLANIGAVYLFENPASVLRLAQEFDVGQAYVPSKASLYLRRAGNNINNFWTIYSDKENTIDSSNFASITQEANKLIFDDRITNYTGNGYMVLAPGNELTLHIDSDGLNYGIINYPIKADVANEFYLWIRCIASENENPSFDDPSAGTIFSSFEMEIFIDGIFLKSIGKVINCEEWEWVYATKLVLPDTHEHTLGVRIKTKGGAIDKLYLDTENIEPYGDGPFYSTSPYLTTHLKVYEASHTLYPEYPLFIYDYKTTIDEIIQDDWYNFNIRVLDTTVGYTESHYFDEKYFLVLSCTGNNRENFILWELLDSSEYVNSPSFSRI